MYYYTMSEEKKQKATNHKELKKKFKECKKLRDEYLAGWQRTRADFLNYKKEETERVEKIREFTKNELILKILKILDDFERAKRGIPEELGDSDWLKGFFQIENQFKNFLKEEKVEEIKAIEEKFDPNFHEAVGETEKENIEPGNVVEVLEKGYLLNGRLLRVAKVKVAK